MKKEVFEKSKLMVDCLPFCFNNDMWALKGGTAINLFFNDLPRLSVDIDLTYLPIEPRKQTLENITNSLTKIGSDVQSALNNVKVYYLYLKNSPQLKRIDVERDNAKIKIEPNLILRGAVYETSMIKPSWATTALFNSAPEVRVLSYEDVYAGKMCAALDRQHPRDYYDLNKYFLENSITDKLRKAFIVYAISGTRPLHEMLAPNIPQLTKSSLEEVQGMIRENEMFTNDAINKTRLRLLQELRGSLTAEEKDFLVTFISGNPVWEKLELEDVKNFPAVKWKLLNIY